MLKRFNIQAGITGLLSTGIPFIFKGLVNEFLTERQIDVPTAVELIRQDKSFLKLFEEFSPDSFETVIQRAAHYIKETDWLTSDWLIDACREEHPDIASLFLGWTDARIWLDKQTEEFRQAFNQANQPAENPDPPVVEKPACPPPAATAPAPASSPVELPASEKPERKDKLPENFPSMV